MKQKLQNFLTLIALLFFVGINSQSKVWKKAKSSGEFQGHSIEKLDENNSEVIGLDFTAFKKQLVNAPLRGVNAKSSDVIIELPNEKGELQAFRVLEVPVFSPSLSAKYPEIKSYVGFSTDKLGAIVRMSVSPKGVQTMISYKNKPTVFMQPIHNDVKNYVVYNRLSKNNLPTEDYICSTTNELVKDTGVNNITQRSANDQTLRKFRLVVSVTGEYTSYHGGTVAGALAAINATITRVNAVFETDMAITFEVQDFPALIYTNGLTDPYSNASVGTASSNSNALIGWGLQLQNTLTSNINNSDYDIGHLFGASGGGGNAGCIGCVCVDDTSSTFDKNKGAGFTSPADGQPEGDTFDIDYVAHEIGHQMGANHTFSHGTEGYGVNVEPGSGSTIMGYAGITTSNVQQHSDPYFHYASIKQIVDNVVDNRTCWQSNSPVTLANNPPVVNAGSDYVIPRGTPYVLRGSATDADGEDQLMYTWEQIDNGQVTTGQFGPTRAVGAMTRSLPPSTSSNRYVPKLSRVVAGQLTETNPASGDDWETVSNISRDLNFALTVRDRQPTATGLNGQTAYDLMKITVDDSVGPFMVTSQNSNVLWDAGSTETVTWDVAGTNAGTVNASKVNILLSIDGGVTFPYTLATDVDNDGTHTFVVPATGGGDTTQARIIVEAKDNIFYAMNSSNFSIQESEFAIAVSNPEVAVCSPNEAIYNFTYNTFLGFTGTTTFSASGLPANATVTFNPATAVSDGTAVTATISGIANVAVGEHNFKIVGTSAAISKDADVTLNIYNGSPNTITLTSPADANVNEAIAPTLMWDADANAISYDVEVATDNAFANIVSSENVNTNSFSVTGLNQSTTYYWRVKGKSLCGDGDFSSVFSFTTTNCSVCDSSGTTTYDTSTTLVKFNTIDNATTKLDGSLQKQGYFDYTSISTDVKLNETHDLTVNVNTDGNYRVQVKAWIDWNHNCSFDDAGEEYDLGFAGNTSDGPTDLSPLSITIPAGASLGNTVMRVSSRYTSSLTVTYPTSCETGFDGEVEDYTINVQDETASLEDFAFSGFNLYPNPTNGEFTLNLEVLNTDKVTVQLFDVRGRLIGEKNYLNTNTNFSENISFDKASAGLYLVKITNRSKQTTRKLVIK
ncbi:M12 family metallo-peptidase [Polaribacter sp. MSW13]|uniref:M12 family metallo-peptidase n=1 Tax=Polaribacter marinus TaxID=2916838 RepID=A0A9X1VLV2_9FLAO|nr:zinc-dependent metalloprotease family protein [Polaribacter marinus]MCI2228889.1 M12 family metallo-peptidase [Polaribacter marinus]